MTLDGAVSEGCACGLALEGRRGQAYNEEAFGYFLAVERQRSKRLGRCFLLLLVDLKGQPGVSVPIDSRLARQVFSGLWLCLRESDFVGWYREGRVAGAVLTELRDRPRTDVSRLLSERVSEVLPARLPSDVARRLRVRVYQNPEAENSEPAASEYEGAAGSRRTRC